VDYFSLSSGSQQSGRFFVHLKCVFYSLSDLPVKSLLIWFENIAEKRPKHVLLTIMLLAALLRVVHIGGQNLWYDESASWYQTRLSYAGIIEESVSSATHPPLNGLLLKFWVTVLGDSEAAMRSMTVLLNLLTMWFLFLFTNRVFNRQIAFYTLLFMAISPFQIYHSNEVRMYTLLTLTAVMTVYYYLRTRDNQFAFNKDFWLYIISSFLMLNTHLFAVFVVGCVQIHFFYSLFIHRQLNRSGMKLIWQWFLAHGIILLISAPFYAVVLFSEQKFLKTQNWRDPMSLPEYLMNILHYFVQVFGGDFSYLYDHSLFQNILVFGTSGTIGLVGLIVFFLAFKDREHPEISKIMVLLPVSFLTIAMLFSGKKIEIARYLLFTVPFFYSFFIYEVNRFKVSWVRDYVLTGAIGVMLIGTVVYFNSPSRDIDIREIIHTLKTDYKSGDSVILVPRNGYPLYYYYTRGTELPGALTNTLWTDSTLARSQNRTANYFLLMEMYRSRFFYTHSDRLYPKGAAYRFNYSYVYPRTGIPRTRIVKLLHQKTDGEGNHGGKR